MLRKSRSTAPAFVDRNVLVVGLGRFGGGVAETLTKMGYEVLAVDSDEDIVDRWGHEVTLAVSADATDKEAMRQLGAGDFTRAVVAIGDLEKSVLAVAILSDLQVPNIWAKALTEQHGKILQRIGAHRVVYPERETGLRVGHMVVGGIAEYLEFYDGFAIVRLPAPPALWNKTIAESAVRSKHNVTIVATKLPERDVVHASPETVIRAEDELLVAGTAAACEAFAAMTVRAPGASDGLKPKS